MRKMTEEEKLSWDAQRVGEFGKNPDGSPRPSLEEVTQMRREKEFEAELEDAAYYKDEKRCDHRS